MRKMIIEVIKAKDLLFREVERVVFDDGRVIKDVIE